MAHLADRVVHRADATTDTQVGRQPIPGSRDAFPLSLAVIKIVTEERGLGSAAYA